MKTYSSVQNKQSCAACCTMLRCIVLRAVYDGQHLTELNNNVALHCSKVALHCLNQLLISHFTSCPHGTGPWYCSDRDRSSSTADGVHPLVVFDLPR